MDTINVVTTEEQNNEIIRKKKGCRFIYLLAIILNVIILSVTFGLYFGSAGNEVIEVKCNIINCTFDSNWNNDIGKFIYVANITLEIVIDDNKGYININMLNNSVCKNATGIIEYNVDCYYRKTDLKSLTTDYDSIKSTYIGWWFIIFGCSLLLIFDITMIIVYISNKKSMGNNN